MKIGVVGLWHLGCVLTASWLKLGHDVVSIDFNPETIALLSKGKAPLYEPQLDEILSASLAAGRVRFSTDPSPLIHCDFVFLSYDTPVDENDLHDLNPLEAALERIAPHLKSDVTFIISSQVPVGTSEQFSRKLEKAVKEIKVIYSPENLRLGEAISNYLNPGHIVIGANTEKASRSAGELFAPFKANLLFMNLASAEMTKHAINSFLATSITFANQLSDACTIAKADFCRVAEAMKNDPRIGKKAYLKAGIGFSGGTLGRDLQILQNLSASQQNTFPLFGDIWSFNKGRPNRVVEKVIRILGSLENKTLSVLGMTYKPGTSTLRRSIPLEIAHLLSSQGEQQGAQVKVFDPKADWSEADLKNIQIMNAVADAVQKSDLLLILTEWDEFKHLNYKDLGTFMTTKKLFDPSSFLSSRHEELRASGYEIFTL